MSVNNKVVFWGWTGGTWIWSPLVRATYTCSTVVVHLYNMASSYCVKRVIIMLIFPDSHFLAVYFFASTQKEMIIVGPPVNHVVTTLIVSDLYIVEMQQSCSRSRLCPYLHVMIQDFQTFYISRCVLYVGIYFVLPKNKSRSVRIVL